MNHEITETTPEDEIAAASGGNIAPEAPLGSDRANEVLGMPKKKGFLERFGIVEKAKDWSGDGLPPVHTGPLDEELKTKFREDDDRQKALAQASRTGKIVVKNPTEEVEVIDVDRYAIPVTGGGVSEQIDVNHRN